MIILRSLLYLSLFFLLLALAGCYSSRHETIQVEDTSYFAFTGNLDDALVSVLKDGVTVWNNLEVDEDERYVIKPGTYEVMVTREGREVVHRKIFLDSGKTAEIRHMILTLVWEQRKTCAMLSQKFRTWA